MERAAAGGAAAIDLTAAAKKAAAGSTIDHGVRHAADYVLCAAVWHVGSHAGAGHYLADVRQPPSARGQPAQWKRFNDAAVQPVVECSHDLLANGYMYFYMHRSVVGL